ASRLQRALLLDEDSSNQQKAIRADVAIAPTPLDGTGPALELPEPARRPRDRRGSMGPDPWMGKVVDSRYRVIDVLGRGGMGVVYKIEHQRMGKIAAMKVLHRDLAGDKEVIGRFRREAEAVSKLTHPNTVQVFDFGTAQGALYLVMEYVRGLDIGSLIDRDGAMSFERSAPLFAQVCAALAEAHELGIVHRDLKPENILVTRTSSGKDFVKVLDFGLAKLAEREELSEVTGRGQIVGSPYYMSPEQIRGEEEVDGRSDIYSLGSLMYKVLTGEPAFTATSPVGVLTKHLTEAVTPPSRRTAQRLPDGVDEIVLKAMQKRADDRYVSVGEMLEDIDALYEEVHEHSSSGRRAVRPSRPIPEEPDD
ncbi:MAG TPA: protein kinase, partial [Candidatus Udaeobacter sp.]|nr:protein kinase [Candidatus Udaeobacter sp.]